MSPLWWASNTWYDFLINEAKSKRGNCPELDLTLKHTRDTDKHIQTHPLEYTQTYSHTCIYIHTYISITHVYTDIRTCTHTYGCIPICVKTDVHPFIHTFTKVRTWKQTSTYTHILLYTYIYTHMSTYAHSTGGVKIRIKNRTFLKN